MKDIDTQFTCENCTRYNQCEYYHKRKKDSYICKYFHLFENATNGDVIKSMFPQAFFDDYVNQWDEVESVVMNNEIYFDIDWWNAPYKTSQENET